MTLEDFFTLTEMKDGFTAPARVKELVAVMQKEKNSFVKNVADTTRQWAAVASTIAATENQECLDLFIQLDGLWFMDRWLKDAQTFSSEANDCFVEEAISAVLQAIEKLQIDTERLTSSGICITVKSLFNCKSARIQGKARALFDSWKVEDGDVHCMGVEKATISDDPNLNNEHLKSQSTASDASPTSFLGDQKLEGVDSVESGKKKLSNDEDSSQMTSDHADCKDGCPDTVASPVKLESVASDPSTREEVRPSDGKLNPKCPAATRQGTSEVISGELKSGSLSEDARHDNRLESFPDRSGKTEVSSASGDSDSRDNSSRTDAKPDVGTYDAKKLVLMKNTVVCDKNQPVGESSNGMDDSGGLEQKILVQDDGTALEETKDQGTTISGSDDIDKYQVKRHRKSERKYFGNSCKFENLTKNSKTSDIIRQTKDMDLEDGTVDALEVARLVAKEVEREVVRYYEQSDNSVSSSSSSSSSSSLSSEKISRADARELDSLESINRGKDLQIDSPVAELPKMENASPEKFRKELLISSASLDTNVKNHTLCVESSQVTNAVQDPGSNTEKSFLEFDLNQEFSSESLDHQVDNVSRYHRASDSDRYLSGRATSSGSRQRQDFVDIDLNVAELSPKRSERLKFDLNRTDEDGVVPSPASSSSCMQPSMKNFDLNDNPSNCNDSSDKSPFHGDPFSHKANPNPFVGPQDDAVISILGTKVKKNTFPPISLPFPNRRASEPVMDASLLRGGTLMGLGPAVPYPQPLHGYNGLSVGPAVPLASASTYGPGGTMPYMFDSRVSPFVPQIIGSASTVPSSYCSPSLVMNLMGPTPTPNGAGPLNPSLGLNSGYANTVEMGNREPGFLGQLFIPGQGRPSDEQLRDGFRSLSSGFGGGKRKEPDSGWELYTTNYKHHPPPHL